MSKRRVVITGLGAVSPLGLSVSETWENALAGKSGIRNLEHLDNIDAYSTRFGGSVWGFDPENWMKKKDAKKMDVFMQYGMAAGIDAIKDSGIEVTDANAERIGVAIGAGIGGLTGIEKATRLT